MNRTRLKPSKAQIALHAKLPIPMHRTASGGYSDILSDGNECGCFSRKITGDCKSVIYYFSGGTFPAANPPLTLIDKALVESQRQSDESGMPGVFEFTTPAGRFLRVPIQPTPMCEIACSKSYEPTMRELVDDIDRLLYPANLGNLLDKLDPEINR
jgi:hypothetical protein